MLVSAARSAAETSLLRMLQDLSYPKSGIDISPKYLRNCAARSAVQFLKHRAAQSARGTVRDMWDKQPGFGITCWNLD
jgi:ABC-type transport system involved in cytochrome c biogenesis ATPase subunit